MTPMNPNLEIFVKHLLLAASLLFVSHSAFADSAALSCQQAREQYEQLTAEKDVLVKIHANLDLRFNNATVGTEDWNDVRVKFAEIEGKLVDIYSKMNRIENKSLCK